MLCAALVLLIFSSRRAVARFFSTGVEERSPCRDGLIPAPPSPIAGTAQPHNNAARRGGIVGNGQHTRHSAVPEIMRSSAISRRPDIPASQDEVMRAVAGTDQ